MAIITRFTDKIKLFLLDYTEEVGISFIIIFVAISSFFLGKYSVLSQKLDKRPIQFEGSIDNSKVINSFSNQAGQVNLLSSENSNNDGQVVASKIGKRYYPLTCAGASRISDKNKIFFASVALAEKAGLTLAAGCK